MSQHISELVTRLVQSAPAIDEGERAGIVAALDAITEPPAAAHLARSIAAIVARLGQPVDPGIALPPLAMACATLTDVVDGRLTAREADAARYEIDTLLPVPPTAPIIAAPDVPLTRLKRS